MLRILVSCVCCILYGFSLIPLHPSSICTSRGPGPQMSKQVSEEVCIILAGVQSYGMVSSIFCAKTDIRKSGVCNDTPGVSEIKLKQSGASSRYSWSRKVCTQECEFYRSCFFILPPCLMPYRSTPNCIIFRGHKSTKIAGLPHSRIRTIAPAHCQIHIPSVLPIGCPSVRSLGKPWVR